MHCRPKDKKAELWDGPRTGVNNAPSFFSVDEAHCMADLPNYFSKYYIIFNDFFFLLVPECNLNNLFQTLVR